MKKMKFITSRKWSFFQPSEEFWYCCGSKKVYEEDYKEDGYNFLEWETPIGELPIERIKLLNLAPSKPHLKKAVFPKFTPDLTNLEHILFDLHFLRNGQISQIPTSVISMILSRSLGFPDLAKDLLGNKVEWDENMCLENLESLLFIADQDRITNKISEKHFPKLSYLGFKFSNDEELNLFKRFSKLVDLELSNLQDFPLFEYIDHLPLFSLDIVGANNKFDISKVGDLKTLNLLRLNGIRSEIDCQIFTELPELTEIVILNSKKVVNVEALLECKKLNSISFLDCGNPFKKGGSDKFADTEYEILDIKYA
jgi:hypothetical protein